MISTEAAWKRTRHGAGVSLITIVRWICLVQLIALVACAATLWVRAFYFQDTDASFYVTFHPSDLPGGMAGRIKGQIGIHTYGDFALSYDQDEARLAAHVERIRTTYGARRDAMVAALRRELDGVVRFDVPDGGMFLWASIPDADTEELFDLAVRDGVVFVPGRPFYAHRERGDGMRLNFSAMTEARIAEGIARLARAVREQGR